MVTHEEIRDLALLAKLEVPEEELDLLTQEMEKIIAFADTINHAPIPDAGPDDENRLSNVFRPDLPLPSLPQQEILKNAGNCENGYFLVQNRK